MGICCGVAGKWFFIAAPGFFRECQFRCNSLLGRPKRKIFSVSSGQASTPVFKEMSARKALAAELPVKMVLSKHQTAVIIPVLLAWMLTAA
jgi:hypothetical protein